MHLMNLICSAVILVASKPKLPVVKAMYDYTARYQDDMSFQKGDRMEIVSKG